MSWDDRLDELFERALELPRPDRGAFLEDACGDDHALRDELRSLLAAHETQPDFLDRMASDLLGRGFSIGTGPGGGRDLPAGSTFGRYTVVGRSGAGAMGVVYRAHDPELDRPVALKVLAPGLSSDPAARARLKREARAASALDHPNIAVVYEIGSAVSSGGSGEPQVYIAMAHYEGETLDRRIERGRVGGAEALVLFEQLADGLGRAHEHGIVHRDIKPTNLLVTRRGELKILDFGIANVVAGPSDLPDAAAGTPAYMSPEQSRGEGVGTRSDVWAAGVILFELLTGRRPFERPNREDLVRAIQTHDPMGDAGIRDEPPGLLDLLRRCLAKDAADRPADGGALRAELRRIRTTSSRAAGQAPADDARPSIVVLPFDNLGRDAADEYFSDGLTDEVISMLSRVRSLRVLSRTSSMRLKGVESDIATLTSRVGVHYALEGSVRRVGDAVRITARLVDGPRDDTLWSHTYDGSVADVFAIQEKVAYAIVEALRLHLSATEEEAIAARPIADIRAYESYLRARYEGWRFSPEGLVRARRHIESALEIVGDNALLYASLGHILAMHAEVGAEGVALEQIAGLRDRVFDLDPESPRGHWLTAWLAFQRGDMVESARAGEAAVAELPDDPDTLLLLGYVYAHVGGNARATELLTRALEIDPLTPFVHGVQGFVPVLEGRFDDAVACYATHLDMDPESPFANVFVGWSLAYAGERRRAAEVLDRAADRFAGTAFGSFAASLRHGLRGEKQEALRAIAPEFRAAAEHSEMFARELAHCLALAGDAEEALVWIEREIQLGMWNHAYLARHDRLLDDLRGDPRFEALVERARELSEAFWRSR